MRLSEAIRLGSVLHRQGFGSFYSILNGEKVTCAAGAAREAIGAHNFDNWLGDVLRTEHPYRCFECNAFITQNLCGIIAHLNDAHRWTRERIADWVETVEPDQRVRPDMESPAVEEVCALARQ